MSNDKAGVHDDQKAVNKKEAQNVNTELTTPKSIVVETSLTNNIPRDEIQLTHLDDGFILKVEHAQSATSDSSCYESNFTYNKVERFGQPIEKITGQFNKNGIYEVHIEFKKPCNTCKNNKCKCNEKHNCKDEKYKCNEKHNCKDEKCKCNEKHNCKDEKCKCDKDHNSKDKSSHSEEKDNAKDEKSKYETNKK